MELLKKVQKNDRCKLLKCDFVKKYIKENSLYLNRYKITCPIKKEDDFFYFEALIQTLKNKEIFEGAFVKAYDDMIDYWQTLTYEERKRLVNADLEKTIATLPYVQSEQQKLYLPCMNDKINVIYEKEMVLFELKQYNRLCFDCKDMIDKSNVTFDMVKSNFVSLNYVQGDQNDYWCYCKINHTLYHFNHTLIMDSFPIVNFNGEVHELCEFIQFYENKDEESSIHLLINKDWLSDRMKKKVIKQIERRKK